MTDKMPKSESEFALSEYDDTIRFVLESGGEFRIYPKGTSMLPLIKQGRDSVCLVKPKSRLKAGDIAFYRRDNGHYVLHRVIKTTDEGYIICGDNQLSLEGGITDDNIIAKVSKIYRKGRLITEEKLLYRAYKRLWSSFFIRRVYFKLRSIAHKICRTERR
ncbi:S24/S26 family peptidase [Ruminococcus sp.]|uniref:S24/S26 family peptidase n=1 Tax=Ruminococcus sp. TaxID=41978 RepID=UPI0025CFE084|nr:S24/S26 family peptidase [Ruminococcus sp.]